MKKLRGNARKNGAMIKRQAISASMRPESGRMTRVVKQYTYRALINDKEVGLEIDQRRREKWCESEEGSGTVRGKHRIAQT